MIRRSCPFLPTLLIIMTLSIPLCAQSYLNPPFTVDYDITQWIRTHALPFRIESAFDPLMDFTALHSLVGDARMVAGVSAAHDALYNARTVLWNEMLSSQVGAFATAGASRDRFMAENALWWLETCGPGSRMLMSNHTMHVSRNFFGLQNMGAYISQALSEDLVVFGTTFHDGSFLVIGEAPSRRFRLEEIQTSLPDVTSYEYAFQSTWIPRFFLDLRGATPENAGADWLLKTSPFHRMYNAAFSGYRSPECVSLSLLFDVIIRFQTTIPAWLLP